MKCPNCGAEIKVDDQKCAYCGSKLTETMQNQQQAEKIQQMQQQQKIRQTNQELNKAGCPKCGSDNISFSREKQGENKGKNGIEVVRATVGVCKDCGYTWYVDEPKKGKRKTWLWVLGWIFIFPVPLTILMLRKKDVNLGLKYGIIAVAWLIYLVFAFSSNSSDNSRNQGSAPSDSTQIVESANSSDVDPADELADEIKRIEENSEMEVDTKQVEENSTELSKESANDKSSEKDEISEDTALSLYKATIENALKENIPGEYEIQVDKDAKIVSVLMSIEGVTMDAVLLKAQNGNTPEEWVSMRENLEIACRNWWKEMPSYGLDDWNLAMYLLNDVNKENALLAVMDGVTVVDALEE